MSRNFSRDLHFPKICSDYDDSLQKGKFLCISQIRHKATPSALEVHKITIKGIKAAFKIH